MVKVGNSRIQGRETEWKLYVYSERQGKGLGPDGPPETTSADIQGSEHRAHEC